MKDRLLVVAFVVTALGVSYNRGTSVTPATGPLVTTPLSNASDPARQISAVLDPPGWMTAPEKVIFASVPDPDTTSLRLLTDRAIENILLAAFREGYVLQASWLPWRTEADKDTPEGIAAWKLRRQYPGALSLLSGGRRLVFFLIPETPTAGVDTKVLDKAVELLDGSSPGRNDVDYLGPAFTGGVTGLDRWRTANTQKLRLNNVYSGTVTGVHQTRSMRLPLKTVQFPQKLAQEKFAAFWKEHRGNRQPEIISVSEDSTTFGREVGEQAITYPWQLSRLRNLAATGQSEAAPAGRILNTPLQLRDSRVPFDALPSYAPSQLAVSQEVALSQISEMIDQRSGVLISLSYTDVLDAVFLTRFLRAANPDHRLLYFDADLLTLKAQDGAPYPGSLSVATNGLSPSLRMFGDTQTQFDSEWSHGYYEAARALIAGRALPKHPLLLMTTGRDGYWPVALLEPGPERLNTVSPSLIWRGVFWAATGVVWTWILVVAVAWHGRQQGLEDYTVPPDWEDGRLRAHAQMRALTMLWTTVAFALLYAIQGAPVWMGSQLSLYPRLPWMFWGAMVGLAAVGIAIARDLRPARWTYLPPIAILAAPLAIRILSADDPHLVGTFALLRSQSYTNGVSPSLPLLLLALGIWAIFYNAFRRASLTRDEAPTVWLGSGSAQAKLLLLLAESARAVRRWNPKGMPAMVFFGPFLVIAVVVNGAYLTFHTVESWRFDVLYIGLLALLSALISFLVCQMLLHWTALRKLLEALAGHPLRHALAGLPQENVVSPLWVSERGRRIGLARLAECLERYRASTSSPSFDAEIAEIRSYLALAADERSNLGTVMLRRRLLDERLAKLASAITADLEDGAWSEGGSHGDPRKDAASPDRALEEYLALRWTDFIRYELLHLRYRLTSTTLGFVAIVLSLNSYPFGQERVIAGFLGVMLLIIGIVMVKILSETHRDATLSLLTNTKAGELDAGFYWRLVTASALPALSLLASYSPSIGRILRSWLQPAMEALK